MRKNSTGFTLVELLAVMIVLAVILAIAVPSISNIIKKSQVAAFSSDAKLLLRSINLKKLEDVNLDVTSINETNIEEILNIEYKNYRKVEIISENGNIAIKIAGKGKWEGLSACGTYKNMRVIEDVGCEGDIWPPVITILGDETVTMIAGNQYNDAGATALDDVDGVVAVTTTGNINANKDGTYLITYTATDKAGNTATATRTVIIHDEAGPFVTFNPNGDIQYLKSNLSTVMVTDGSGIDDSSLRYHWSLSVDLPSLEQFMEGFNNNQSIVTPSDLTGSYYLWIKANDIVGNETIIRSNVFNLDNTKPIITMNGDSHIIIEKGSVYIDAGATAIDNHSGIAGAISVTGTINPNIVGTYVITYNVRDLANNAADTVTRTVDVIDVSAPIITLNGANPIYVNVGSVYNDPGATALDDVDGNLTNNIITTGNVNPNIPGTYVITYTVNDQALNESVKTRTVIVVDNIAPTIAFGANGNTTYAKTRSTTVTVSDIHTGINASSLKYLWNTSVSTPSENSFTTNFTNGGTISSPASVSGGYYLWILAKDNAGNTSIQKTNVFNLDNTKPIITINGNSSVNINVGTVYTDLGATATDNVDATVTVVTTGTINVNVAGTYTVTYNATDSSGNIATSVTRTVTVVDNIAPTIVFGMNGNATYAKTRNTTVTASDSHTGINASSLKYLWNTSTTTPSEASFTTAFTSGGSISSPALVTGGYYLWILAKDNAGNTTIVRSNVFNLDNTIPVITLVGSSSTTIVIGSAYTDPGATATDNINGNITGSIVKTGTVNVNVAGTYTLTYNVSDAAGNAATPVTRTVIVTGSITISTISSAAAFAVDSNGIYIVDSAYIRGFDFNGVQKWATPFTVATGMSALSSRGGMLTLANGNVAVGLYYSDSTYRHLGIMQLDKNGNFINLSSLTAMSSSFGQALHLYTECTSNIIAYYRGKAGSSYMNYFGHVNVSTGADVSKLYYDDSGSYDYPRYPYYSSGNVYFWWDSNNGGNYLATYTIPAGSYSVNHDPTTFQAPAQFYYSSPSIGTQFINTRTDMYEYANGKTYYLYKNPTTLIYEIKIEAAS